MLKSMSCLKKYMYHFPANLPEHHTASAGLPSSHAGAFSSSDNCRRCCPYYVKENINHQIGPLKEI